jgi:homoserine kinase type II
LSVFTTVRHAELAAWLQPLGVGELIEHAGIAAGVQNSNYFVTTSRGRWVLTLFENLPPAALDFYLALMAHLAGRGIVCPQPRPDNTGKLQRPLAGKPAALLSCLPGTTLENPGPEHCARIGTLLARLHLAAADFPAPLPNPCGAAWRQATGESLLACLTAAERELLVDELRFQASQDYSRLPRGVIHADLFRDNVLWDDNGQPAGVLDFYFAGEDVLLFDLAVVANDWCPEDQGLPDLVAAYRAERQIDATEAAAWPALRRAAALRFWLLRLEARHRPRPGDVVTVKNPDHFRQLLQQLRLAGTELPR